MDVDRIGGYLAGAVIVLIVLEVGMGMVGSSVTGQVDDWQYTGGTGLSTIPGTSVSIDTVRHVPGTIMFSGAGGRPFATLGSITTAPLMVAVPLMLVQNTLGGLTAFQSQATGGVPESGDLGYATGGAKDIQNFRDNLEEGYLPQPTDISYEGLFYEYYFNTGRQQECEQLFCPSYSRAVTDDPLSGETEQYMTVGLNSNLGLDEFERKDLNMVLVLDISGSMGSGFGEYYYDRFGNRQPIENATDRAKMRIAAESLSAMTEHLREGDRLGVVLFNNDAHVAKPLRLTQETDMEAIRSHMQEVQAGGGTNMDAGMRAATEMVREYEDADRTEYENRIVFLTDAMPNIGRTSEEGLFDMMQDNAEDGIYTTFVGMGVDFNTELVDAITAVEGANYLSVHSADQFRQRLDEEFKYLVTPLVFNLTLELDSDAFSIEKVYGSTAAEEATGEILKVNTLFPSPTTEEGTQGGVVLAQLEQTGPGTTAGLEVSYEDRTGERSTTSRAVDFGEHEPEYFETTGVRKAVLLSRYADLMKNWIAYERVQANGTVPDEALNAANAEGIEPPTGNWSLNEWEQQSVSLSVGPEYERRIRTFQDHFSSEMDALGDEELDQELDMMDLILSQAG